MPNTPDMFSVERVENPNNPDQNSIIRVLDMGSVDRVLNALKAKVWKDRHTLVDAAFAEMMMRFIWKKYSWPFQDTFRWWEQAFQEAQKGNMESLAKRFWINIDAPSTVRKTSENIPPSSANPSVVAWSGTNWRDPLKYTGLLNAPELIKAANKERLDKMQVAMNGV